MNRTGMDRAVVVPAGATLAVYNREGNDAVLAAAREHPDRLIPFTTANPWYGDKAVDELVRTFDAGSAGVKLHPMVQGFRITDAMVRPLVDLCAERGRPIYFHTGTPVTCMPYQLAELAAQCPEVVFIMGRMSWSDFWNDVPYACRGMDNIYLETSHHLPFFIELCRKELGSHRLLFGSDWPANSMALEVEKITRYVSDEEDRQNILGGTMACILGQG